MVYMETFVRFILYRLDITMRYIHHKTPDYAFYLLSFHVDELRRFHAKRAATRLDNDPTAKHTAMAFGPSPR
jgi:hypothetical protein